MRATCLSPRGHSPAPPFPWGLVFQHHLSPTWLAVENGLCLHSSQGAHSRRCPVPAPQDCEEEAGQSTLCRLGNQPWRPGFSALSSGSHPSELPRVPPRPLLVLEFGTVNSGLEPGTILRNIFFVVGFVSRPLGPRRALRPGSLAVAAACTTQRRFHACVLPKAVRVWKAYVLRRSLWNV